MAVPVQDPMELYRRMIAPVQPQMMPGMPGAPQFQPMGFLPPDLGPEEVAYFDSLMTRLNQNFGQGAAQNLFQQTMLGSEQGIRETDLNRRFDQMRERLPGQYQKRGIMNSGIYQQGLTDYGTDRTNALADLQRGFQNQMGGLQQQYAQMGQTYATGMSDLERQRAAKRHAKAATLRTVL